MKKKTLNPKTVAGVLLMLLAFNHISAQDPYLFFEEPSPHPSYHQGYGISGQKPYCYVTEVAPSGATDGFYLMTINDSNSCSFLETDPVSLPLVYKLSQRGELLGVMTLGFENRYSYVYGAYPARDDPQCFLTIGIVHDNDLHYERPFIARFDSDLNLLWQREVELPEPYRKYLAVNPIMDSQGNFFCLGIFGDCNSTMNDAQRFCFRLTPNGELDGLLQLSSSSYGYSPFIFPDGSGDYGCLETLLPNGPLTLLRINNDMQQTSQQEISTLFSELDPSGLFYSFTIVLESMPTPTIIPLPNNTFVLVNEAKACHQDLNTGSHYSYGIGFLWVNQKGEALSYATDEYTFINDSLNRQLYSPLANDDTFYFVYIMGEHGGWGYDYSNCFVVGKMDFQGNLLWRRYWNKYNSQNGMKVYYPQHTIASHDNGCIVTGFSYQSDINDPNFLECPRNVFLLKFFADGSFDNASELDSQIRPFAFWPNPADERLSLEFSPDVNPVKLEFYDLNGRLLITQNDRFGSMDLSGLPAGLYTLRVTLSDGITYSDKVVKQ